jgi:hypothetical protein
VVPGAEHTDFISSPATVALVQALILDFLRRHGDSGDPAAPSASPAGESSHIDTPA